MKAKEEQQGIDFLVQQDKDWFDKSIDKIVTIKSSDKKDLRAFLIKSKNPNNHLYLVYAHGWLGYPYEKTVVLRKLYEDLDINILILEQRGQNNSQIRYISWGSAEGKDIISWSKWIDNFDNKANIFLYGQSMGAASIMYSMSFGNTKSTIGIIEDCGYLSIKKQFIATATPVVGKIVSNLFTPSICIALWLTGTSFFKNNPLNGIRNNTIPFLAIHGDADELVPYSNFEEIKVNIKKQCNFSCQSFSGAKHACSVNVDQKLYIKIIENFVKKEAKF